MANTNANRRRTNTASHKKVNNARNRQMYIEGSAARELAAVPRKAPAKKTPREPRPVSQSVQRNRARAKGMSPGFVVFLVGVSVCILFSCITYLQLKSDITTRMKAVASLESQLSQLRDDNDEYYSQVTSNIDMDRIKKIAIGRLGMKYPTEEQIRTYHTEGGSYVRQYQDIPESKR